MPGELLEEGGHATRVHARHPEAGPGHVHRLAGHGDPGVTRLRHEARVTDGDLGPEPRVPDLQVSNISLAQDNIVGGGCSPGAGPPYSEPRLGTAPPPKSELGVK